MNCTTLQQRRQHCIKQMSAQPAIRRAGQARFVSEIHSAYIVHKNHMRSNVGEMQTDKNIDNVIYGLNISVCVSSSAQRNAKRFKTSSPKLNSIQYLI
jgi:hypothetical protein